MAIEISGHLFIIHLPTQNGEFPSFFVCLPEATMTSGAIADGALVRRQFRCQRQGSQLLERLHAPRVDQAMGPSNENWDWNSKLIGIFPMKIGFNPTNFIPMKFFIRKIGMNFVGFHQWQKGDLTVLDAWGFTINGRFTEKEVSQLWVGWCSPIQLQIHLHHLS